MIVYLKGKLIEKAPSTVIIDVGGVGYEVFISVNTYDRLPASGSECMLRTYHHIREDAQILFGFFDEKEKKMFEMLLNVNGVGAKTALSILSGLTVIELSLCIAESNIKRISSVHGIGKKTAERIAMELRDKINPFEALSGSDSNQPENTIIRDAVMALTSLGFTQEKATKMVQAVLAKEKSTPDTETLLRKALSSK
ncbi:MAG: Holliday junction branch migration protein RuvA [Kiritimatiellae bacterium]|jgi:Holliday junction DNA helicase RuvA|nr:Holliday junction branch migration protein RuvA [Kiritimatiellia bacterium]